MKTNKQEVVSALTNDFMEMWMENGDTRYTNRARDWLEQALQTAYEAGRDELLKDVVGGAFARCNELRIEIENQEEEHGIADRSTLDRYSEANKNYHELKEALTNPNNSKYD